ncbi:TetR/AcrR family transcriptional regulator [Actinokineospora auranticolor]|uniref:AcrR family transcriptional regulator n=1 Tax=Actinokineospora auranticolor TaxID=155976 RepID=A0A2S6GHJ7_9PSEU|nr:TetR/AcrR family transcriptional regulator [Actinokineospora auranticolor]PPK64708.1 AcrR family transcriptional regulator [Actinokineospora auranticolor]
MVRLADKRRSILDGALATFARDGYTRASIDAISAAAGVSTRTIYNHFADKAALFGAVIEESATRVADAQTATIDRHLSKVTDLEADLVAFAIAWVRSTEEFPDHFALVRQVNVETAHVPEAALVAWQENGPLRAQRELAAKFSELADRGLLRLDDPVRGAIHFMMLVSTQNPSLRTRPTEAELDEIATTGVRAFLYGYRAH